MKIFVKVKPGAKEDKVEKINDNGYFVSVKEKAQDGKANARLINILAKEFGVSFRSVVIKNPTSRKKIIDIKCK